MSIKNWNAGIIRPVAVAPAGPYQNGAAPGVWTLDQVAFWTKQGLWPIAGNAAPVGFFAGGATSTANTNVIQYVNITTTGNAIDFGDLITLSFDGSGCSSSTRGIVAGGQNSNVIQYITIATAGNSVDFGDLNAQKRGLDGASNSTRGLFAGGSNTGSSVTGTLGIYYITIATTGNAVFFGNLSVAKMWTASCASTTRAVFAGGYDNGSVFTSMDYSTISTTGNTTNFGSLTFGYDFNFSGAGSGTRGIFGGSEAPGKENVIQYITIATTGNTLDFGDLTAARFSLAACASSVRVVFGGGYNSFGVTLNVIDYVTSSTVGNAVDFGDLIAATYHLSGFSNAHAGI